MTETNQEQCNIYIDLTNQNENAQDSDRFDGVIPINSNRRNQRHPTPIQQNGAYHSYRRTPNLLEQFNSIDNNNNNTYNNHNNNTRNIVYNSHINNNTRNIVYNSHINNFNNVNNNEDNDDDKLLSENIFDLKLEDPSTIEECIEELTKGHDETNDYSNFDIFDYSKMLEDEVELLKRKRLRRRRKK